MPWIVTPWQSSRAAASVADVEKTQLEQFGAKVREIREAAGFTQEAFAHHARIDRAFYGRVERGKQNVALNTVFKIAQALGVEPAELFRGISGSIE